MSELEPVGSDIWCASAPGTFLGLHMGVRMTIVRLHEGGVLLHSPIAIDKSLGDFVDSLGDVRFIVCPNLFHHLHAGQAIARWPRAKLYGPHRLQQKRSDLCFDGFLEDPAPSEWGNDFDVVTIEGSIIHETVLYHRWSRTLISADLVEYFPRMGHRPTRWFLRIGGLLGRVGWHRFYRVAYANRAAARRSVDEILALPFDKIVLSHGEIVCQNANASLRQAMAWLRP